MISFASSIWLWAIAGISIPVLIHLWNVRKGKTLKIGSIAFFNESPVSRARSLQLTDLIQLLIRCLLFIILAFLVAKPMWRSKISPKDKGWMLMERSSIGAAYQQYGPEIDSLLAQGMELHELGKGFVAITLADSSSALPPPISYWSLLHMLEKKIPAGLPVTLYTDNRLERFEGQRPSLAIPLDWNFVTTNGEKKWIENLHSSYDDSIVIVEGKSTSRATSFKSRIVSTLDTDSLTVDSSVLRVVVFSDPGTPDARYLLGAIDAVKEITKQRIEVEVARDANAIPGADWLFWLSTQKIPAGAQAKNIFSYAAGNSRVVQTSFTSNAEQVPVYKLYSDSLSLIPAHEWRTGLGYPIMTEGQHHLIFYSRFDPAWNEWVWSTSFPKFIMNVLFSKGNQKERDLRQIDIGQAIPGTEARSKLKTGTALKDISSWTWLLALLLLIVERILAYRKQKGAGG